MWHNHHLTFILQKLKDDAFFVPLMTTTPGVCSWCAPLERYTRKLDQIKVLRVRGGVFTEQVDRKHKFKWIVTNCIDYKGDMIAHQHCLEKLKAGMLFFGNVL